MKWAGNIARMGEMRNAHKILVTKHEGRKPLGRPEHRWKNNIKMDFKEVGCESVDWIHVVQNRVKWWTVVDLQVL
jgi:hypothetical protein